jgi:hypothetical protein
LPCWTNLGSEVADHGQSRSHRRRTGQQNRARRVALARDAAALCLAIHPRARSPRFGRANRRISDNSPAAYIPDLFVNDGDQAFTSQCIPTNPALLTPERYRDFLAERRRMIAERLNDFLY